MSTKKLLGLTAVFLALLAFVLLYERFQPTSEESAKARRRLIDFKVENVTSLLVERPGAPKVDVKKNASGRWQLAGDAGGPADSVTVDGLVSDLNKLELLGEARKNFDPKEFGLDAPKAKATLGFKDGSKAVVSFGVPVPGTDTTAASDGERFAAVKYAPVTTLEKPFDDFRSKTLVEVPSSEITRMTIVKGPTKLVVARETEGKGKDEAAKADGEWWMESPVKDLASKSFVQQLLADFGAARVSEFPLVPASDLPKIGLQPPNVTVTLQKGAEVVSNVAFGAVKADTTGKLYARRDNLMVVVDDRLQESLAKELTAFRETKVLPADSWTVTRVSFDAGGERVGAEKVENEWRSMGKPVNATVVLDLVDRLARLESKAFVGKKDYAAHGIPVAVKGKVPTPLATMEILREKETTPRTAVFYAAEPAADTAMAAVEVTGRMEAMLIDRSALDELKALATKLKSVAAAGPAPIAPAAKASTVSQPPKASTVSQPPAPKAKAVSPTAKAVSPTAKAASPTATSPQ